MPDNVEPHPPTQRITHARLDRSLERTLLSAILVGGVIGACGVIGFAAWVGLRGPNQPASARPTAIVITVTPSPIVPTPTASPRLPPTPGPEGLYVGGYAQVSGTGNDTLRLRSDPGLQATTLKTVPDGTQLLILDGPREADSITWWRLRDLSDGAEGWAAQLYLVPASAP